jgi:hypothetical protein
MVIVLYCRSLKILYIIHSPETYESGVKEEERLRKMIEERRLNIDVVRLNTGNEWDTRRAEEILEDGNCVDYIDFLAEILNE